MSTFQSRMKAAHVEDNVFSRVCLFTSYFTIRECVPSPGHFFHLPITFIVVFQINACYVYMLNTYLSIQL